MSLSTPVETVEETHHCVNKHESSVGSCWEEGHMHPLTPNKYMYMYKVPKAEDVMPPYLRGKNKKKA